MLKNFLESAKKLKDTRVLCSCAILIALYVVLYSVKIPLASDLRITFTFIPLALCGWLFGCVPAILVGIISDILSSIFFPMGAYFPGFTLTSALTGFIFGLFLYKQEKILTGVIFSKIIVNIILNTVLNALWLTMLYSKGYIFYLSSHFLKNIVSLGVDVIVLVMIIKILTRYNIKKMYK